MLSFFYLISLGELYSGAWIRRVRKGTETVAKEINFSRTGGILEPRTYGPSLLETESSGKQHEQT